MSTHITEIIKKYASQLLGREETKQLIEHLKGTHPTLVEEVTPEPLSTGDVQKVLAKLLSEQVSIKNLPIIFETLADFGKMTTDTDLLAEYCRQSLSLQITKQYMDEQGIINVITISPNIEKLIAEHIHKTDHGNFLNLDPENQQKIIEAINQERNKAFIQDGTAIVLCSPAVRMYIKQLISRHLPDVVVLSYNELEPDVDVESSGVVNLS